MNSRISRRTAIGAMTASAAALAAKPAIADDKPAGRIKQSVCKWCYGNFTVDQLCQNSKEMGILSVELLGEKDWDIPKKYGLTCAMPTGLTSIGDGWNRIENHERFIKDAERLIPMVKEAGMTNLICFSGNRKGMSDSEGMDNCAKGLKQIMPTAEKHGITIVMELLNSKVDHHDY